MTETKTYYQNPLGTETDIEEVIDAFEFLDDWEERYAYIIELGKKLPPFPEEQKTDENFVHGCQSQVWVSHLFDPETNKLYLLIDSDAMIVRGLAAIILCMLNAKSPEAVQQTDVDSLFEKLDLFRHISPTRGNGLRAMLQKIKSLAASTKQ